MHHARSETNDISMDGFMRTDARGQVRAVNQAYCRMSGYSREELLGMGIPDLEAGETPVDVDDHLGRIMAQGGDRFESWHRRKDGSTFGVEVNVQYDTVDGGSFIAFLRDRTSSSPTDAAAPEREQTVLDLNRELEQRVAERTAQLEAAMVEQFCLNEQLAKRTADLEEANRCLEAFTTMVSHDLRAPLRRITNFATILEEAKGAGLDPEGKDLLKRITNGCRMMGDLITGMLEFSRIDRQLLQKMTIDTTALASEVWAELQSDAEGRSVTLVMGELPPCYADRLLLKQVFANLLGNARKFTRFKESATVEVGCELHGGERVFFVKDDGAGFDMAYAANLFGLFQRLHGSEFEGTGIGLATAKRIIQRHGGRIWAEGEPGHGARFFFTLGE